jgi:lipopolysaccharide transport system ATP-binding protein
MYVRLAFGVAAHLEPEILIVDEVLAVGDAEFQKKALGKMKDVSAKEGRTVLFVSHNMAAIKNLCDSGIVLEKGLIAFKSDEISDVITFYNADKSEKTAIPLEERKDRAGNGDLLVTGLGLFNNKNNPVNNAISGEYLKIHIHYKVNFPQEEIDVGISFWTQSEDCKIAIWSSYTNSQYKNINRDGSFIIHFDHFPLSNGIYFLNVVIKSKDGSLIDWVKNAATLKVEDGDYYNSGRIIADRLNSVLVPHKWIQNEKII